MNKITKKINLEEARIRFGKESESYWGDIANDMTIIGETEDEKLLLEISDNLPIMEESGVAFLRYRTMMDIYAWLKQYIRESEIWKICKRNGEIKFIKTEEEIMSGDTINTELEIDGFISKFGTISKVWAIPSGGTYSEVDESGYTVDQETKNSSEVYKITYNNGECFYENEENKVIGKQYWVKEGSEQLLKYFTKSKNENAKTIIKRINAFLRFTNEYKYGGGDRVGYVSFPIYIGEEIDDLGEFTAAVDFWVENKRYYINDRVQDEEGNVWRLVKTTKNNIDIMKVPTVLNNFINEQIKTYPNTYKQITNISQATRLYDNIDGPIYISGETGNFYYVRSYYNGFLDETHWEKCLEKNSEETNTALTAITESKLLTLQRHKRDYDDDGNELPFIAGNYNKEEECYDTELLYISGVPMNNIVVGDKTYYDYLSAFTYDNEEGIIRFTYCIGASEDNKTGVTYTESYNCQEIQGKFKYDGSEKVFKYLDITYENLVKEKDFDMLPNKLYSIITVNKDDITTDDFQIVQYIKNENLMGVQKINEDIDISIERGKYAAFEKHQVLGEISSFEDLITYKNGFFTLKNN